MAQAELGDEEEQDGQITILQKLNPQLTQSVIGNVDALTIIMAFLSRIKKFQMRGLSRDFRDLVVPRSMVSVRLLGNSALQGAKLGKFM